MFNKSIFNLERLRRITSHKAYIPEIDGLRFISIAAVVFMHLHTHYAATHGYGEAEINSSIIHLLLQDGQNGVLVFFVISGFVLGLPFANQYVQQGRKVNLKTYFIRRLTRLEPPYIFFLTLFLFVHIVLLGQSFREMLPHYFSGLIYSHFFMFNEWNPILPVTWSLETEVQFYILAPMIGLLFLIRRKFIRYIAFVLLMLVDIYFGIHFKDFFNEFHLGTSILYYVSFFLIGFLLADFYLDNKPFFYRSSYLWDVVFIISLVGIFIVGRDLPYPRYMRTFLMLPLMLSAFKGVVASKIMRNRFISVTGGMCYTMYLIHFPLIHLLCDQLFIPTNHYWLTYIFLALIVMPIIWVATALFFLLIEKPCMDKEWSQKLVAYFKRDKPIVS